MNYKNVFYITIVHTIILLVLAAFIFFKFSQETEEIVYVDNVRLFNGFNMTKDLNQVNGLKIKKQKKTLDSLYTIYTIFKENGQTNKLESLEAQLRNEDQALKNMNDQFSNELSQTVWNRLNAYVSEYSIQHDFKIVLGTQGSGNVMYAKEITDVTDDIISYANSSYEGEQ